MSLDARIETKTPPMLGCHSALDKYNTQQPPACNYDHRHEERGCEGCERRSGNAAE